MPKQSENQFVVSLEGIKLSNEQKQRINKGLKEVVMKELGNMDLANDVVLKKNNINLPILIGDRPFPWGIILKNLKEQFEVVSHQAIQ